MRIGNDGFFLPPLFLLRPETQPRNDTPPPLKDLLRDQRLRRMLSN